MEEVYRFPLLRLTPFDVSPPFVIPAFVGMTKGGMRLYPNVKTISPTWVPFIPYFCKRLERMTELPLSQPFFSEPRGTLVLQADTSLGQTLTLALAQPHARLALSSRNESPTFWETISRTLTANAIALPVGVGGEAFTSETVGGLVERVVEDFGRLDLVVYPIEGASRGGVSAEEIEREIVCLARAAHPHLRRARPTGFFLIVSNASLPSGFSLERTTADLAREMATGPQGRPRVLALDLREMDQSLLSSPETLAQLREWIGKILDDFPPTGSLLPLAREKRRTGA